MLLLLLFREALLWISQALLAAPALRAPLLRSLAERLQAIFRVCLDSGLEVLGFEVVSVVKVCFLSGHKAKKVRKYSEPPKSEAWGSTWA